MRRLDQFDISLIAKEQLKELAANHSIQGRSSMTKNLETAHKLLVHQLVGLVAVNEIS